MEDNILIQGTLYLRKGPKQVNSENIDMLRNLTYLLKGEEGCIPYNSLNYTNVDDFHQLFIDNNKMFMVIYRNLGHDYSLREITPEELRNDYIDFISFLSSAEYIGRYGRRTKPAKNGDKSYMDTQSKLIILYYSKTHLICVEEDEINSVIILNSQYCDDWEFYGEKLDIYKTPSELYSTVFKEKTKILHGNSDDKRVKF